MIVTNPPLLRQYMAPTLAGASPTNVTWHQDMANATSNAINNFLRTLKWKWAGTATTGTTTVPLGGNMGMVMEQISFSSGEIMGAVSSGQPSIGLFSMIAFKMTKTFNCQLGAGRGNAFVPLIYTTQPFTFIGTNFIAEAGIKAANEMVQPAESYQDNPYLWYEIMDKYLAQGLSKMKAIIGVTGPSAGGQFTGTAWLSPDVTYKDVPTGMGAAVDNTTGDVENAGASDNNKLVYKPATGEE